MWRHAEERAITQDEELFREWQQGAAGALEALVRRHHAPLLAHLARLTGIPTLAEDLAQETLPRLVGRERPHPAAVQEPPTLEEAYLVFAEDETLATAAPAGAVGGLM